MNLKHTLLASGAFGGMTANERRIGRFIRDGEGHPDPAPAPAAPAEETAVDPFDAAFAEHAAEDPAPAPAGQEAPAAPAAEPGAPAAGAEGGDPPANPGEPAKPADAPAAGDPAVPPAAPAAPAAPALNAEDVLARLADMVGKKDEAPAAPAAPAAEAAPMYTAEEETALAEYTKNWPDVAAAEALRRRAEYHDIFKFVFTEVANYTQPLFEQMRAMGNTLHTAELKEAVPDYSPAVESEVNTWIDTQPAYLQAPFKHVMQNGTSEEVADLIGRYRAATGTAPAAPAPAAPAAAAPAPAAAAPAAAPKTELSSAAKQAAESLAPVSGDRSAVPAAGEDTQDFDSAFARYATAGG